jgi:hypothetical protein
MHEYMKRKLEVGVTILPDPNSNPNKVSRFNESAQIDNRTDIESDIANRAQVTTLNYIPCATFSANLTSALRKGGKGKKPRNIHTYIQQPCRKRKAEPRQQRKRFRDYIHFTCHKQTYLSRKAEYRSEESHNRPQQHREDPFKWRRKNAAEIKQRSTVASGLSIGGQKTRGEKSTSTTDGKNNTTQRAEHSRLLQSKCAKAKLQVADPNFRVLPPLGFRIRGGQR